MASLLPWSHDVHRFVRCAMWPVIEIYTTDTTPFSIYLAWSFSNFLSIFNSKCAFKFLSLFLCKAVQDAD